MSPEQRLWQEVVFKTIIDAMSNQDSPCDDEWISRKQAREWMKGDTRDFFEVCTLAGIDPHFLRENFAAGKIRLEDIKTVRMVRHAAE